MPQTDRLVIRPGRVALWLSLTAAALSIAHLAMVYLRRAHDLDVVMGLAKLFDFFHESNFPSYFSALLLLATAALTNAQISVAQKLPPTETVQQHAPPRGSSVSGGKIGRQS